ncbi:MAG: hypothetical protein M3O70_01305 [Actinomycetota bacterium]|nr:hypothetical protein [Actinomycetota bacterium]
MLNTGRCGSLTLATACQAAILNYTSGHESRAHIFDGTRLDYPDQHIEVDNRLSYFLGGLAAKYPEDVFYVHLTRNPDDVARSFLARWDRAANPPALAAIRAGIRRRAARKRRCRYWRKSNLISAFGNDIILGGPDWDEDMDRLMACRLYVESTTANIRHFLRDKPHMEMQIDSAAEQFEEFCQRIGADADMTVARDELASVRNADVHSAARGRAKLAVGSLLP